MSDGKPLFSFMLRTFDKKNLAETVYSRIIGQLESLQSMKYRALEMLIISQLTTVNHGNHKLTANITVDKNLVTQDRCWLPAYVIRSQ
jgi:hypothetical protein